MSAAELLAIQVPEGTLEVEASVAQFLPSDFVADPMEYFDRRGTRVRRGTVVTYNAAGRIDDDPNAVRDFPVWSNPRGEQLRVVGKRVNTKKSMVRRFANPFYEYRVMHLSILPLLGDAPGRAHGSCFLGRSQRFLRGLSPPGATLAR